MDNGRASRVSHGGDLDAARSNGVGVSERGFALALSDSTKVMASSLLADLRTGHPINGWPAVACLGPFGVPSAHGPMHASPLQQYRTSQRGAAPPPLRQSQCNNLACENTSFRRAGFCSKACLDAHTQPQQAPSAQLPPQQPPLQAQEPLQEHPLPAGEMMPSPQVPYSTHRAGVPPGTEQSHAPPPARYNPVKLEVAPLLLNSPHVSGPAAYPTASPMHATRPLAAARVVMSDTSPMPENQNQAAKLVIREHGNRIYRTRDFDGQPGSEKRWRERGSELCEHGLGKRQRPEWEKADKAAVSAAMEATRAATRRARQFATPVTDDQRFAVFAALLADQAPPVSSPPLAGGIPPHACRNAARHLPGVQIPLPPPRHVQVHAAATATPPITPRYPPRLVHAVPPLPPRQTRNAFDI